MHKLGIQGVTPHTCRHTAATKMAGPAACRREVVKQILGHADIATTLNIYTHPIPPFGRQFGENPVEINFP